MADNGEEVLRELVSALADEIENQNGDWATNTTAAPPTDTPIKEIGAHSQWALGSNGRFSPVGSTNLRLPSGVYSPYADPGSWGLERLPISSDGIYLLPDMATEDILKEVTKFWESEAKYRKHSLLYKRGLLLWGPPGSGKTVTVKLLIQEIIRRDGLVININSVGLAIQALKAIRRIEPNRNLIVLFEDIDEIINYQGEAAVLSMLDGENNIDNILQIATTNYPERLGARIINRPSRFDRRVYIGMPGPEARRSYIKAATGNGVNDVDLEVWVKDTLDMSIAHLRELVAAVYCLDQPYEDVIDRLKTMAVQPKGESGFANKNMGFKGVPVFKQKPNYGGEGGG